MLLLLPESGAVMPMPNHFSSWPAAHERFDRSLNNNNNKQQWCHSIQPQAEVSLFTLDADDIIDFHALN